MLSFIQTTFVVCIFAFLTHLIGPTSVGLTQEATGNRKIVLIAGETAKIDKMGHHDYLAGCLCLEILLKQTPGIEVVQVREGWPVDGILS